jgi:hypothetical protein
MNSPQKEEDIGAVLHEGQKAKEIDYKTHFDFPADDTLSTPSTKSTMMGRSGWRTTVQRPQRATNESTITLFTIFRDKISLAHTKGVSCSLCIENCFSEAQYLAAWECELGFTRDGNANSGSHEMGMRTRVHTRSERRQ